MITTAQVAKLGFSRTLLSNYVKQGLLERSQQGVYILADEIQDDMYAIKLRSKKIVFSHDSAVFLLGISERTPFEHSVTIPSNACLPNTISNECQCYYIKPELHHLGVITVATTFGNEVRTYNLERTVCDMIRSRNKLEEELVIGATRS
ncbi:MAG: hypothetical protein ATN35_11795 [Epulopiscium sp. Nele67-Bin004]|nr:MAG: hypothetical protein ATN35_11795 [Epulopiscium sp. Nele67-Bin004]